MILQRANQESEYEYQIHSLASDIKAFCRVQGYMTLKDGNILQQIGTNLYRKLIDPNIWIRCLSYAILDNAPRVALIPDIRFLNELQWIKDNNGITCRIQRFNNDGSIFLSNDGRDNNHQSEIEVDSAQWDYTLSSYSGNLQQLQNHADFLFSHIENILAKGQS